MPSQTELLSYLGLEKQVVGITKFCIHPGSWQKSKTIVGGTKDFHINRINDLKPDLIIANKEENEKASIEALAVNYPVLVTDVYDTGTALEMIRAVSKLCGKELIGKELTALLEDKITSLVKNIGSQPAIQTAYLIWREPYMTIGSDTYIHSLLSLAGLQNVFGNQKRYPETTIAELNESAAGLILLSSEPYPFKEKHIEELREALPEKIIMLVDGEMCSWYGSRMLKGLDYLLELRQQIGFAFAKGKP